jgi:hypothetical protein
MVKDVVPSRTTNRTVVLGHLRFSDKAAPALAFPLRRNPEFDADETIHAFETRADRMDIERINLIGTGLADLTARTEALRGYL